MTEPAPIPNLAAVVWAAVDEAVVRDPRCTSKVPPHPLTLDRTILESPANPEPWPAVDIGRFLDELPDMESQPSASIYDAASFADIKALCDALPPRPKEIKLTQQQIDRIPKAEPSPPWMAGQVGFYAGVPVRIVEGYWDSTPGERQLEEFRKLLAEELTATDPIDDLLGRYGPYTPDWSLITDYRKWTP